MFEYGKEFFTNGAIISISVIILEFLITKIILTILRRVISQVAKKQGREKDMLYILIKKALSVIMYAIAVMLACQEIVPLRNIGKAILGVSGVLTVVVALGTQKMAENIVAGATIGAYQPFKKGDLINIPEKNITGFIEDLNLRHVVIRTYENSRVIIPNKIIDDAVVENKTSDGVVDNMNYYYFDIGYNSDHQKAANLVDTYLKRNDLVVKKESISVIIFALGESGVRMRAGFETANQGDAFKIKTDLNRYLLTAFKENDIEIPYNYINIINKNDLSS